MIFKSSVLDSLLLKVITSTLLEVFEGSEHDELDPVADLPLKPDIVPKFDLIELYPEFDLIDPDFDLFDLEPCPKFDLIDPEFDPEPVSGPLRTCLLDPDAGPQLDPALPVLPELHPCLLVTLVVDHLLWSPPD